MSTYNHKQDQLDNKIKQALLAEEQPGAELNDLLKAKVRQNEAIMQAEENKRKVSLWYLPMLLNSFVLITLALLLQVFVQNVIVLQIITGVCIYLIIAGIILTIAGIRLSTLKSALTFEWKGAH